jgi:hypothetical protein
MVSGRDIAKVIIVAGVAVFASSSAFADAIDGDWCSAEGKHFRIAGPDITTPAGTRTTGDYSRHAFSYIVPTADPGAGETVAMRLLNEEEVLVSVAGGAPVMWRRCEFTS